MAKTPSLLVLTDENKAALAALAKAKGVSMSEIVNTALDEYILKDLKTRTIVNALSRIRRQQNQQERLMFAMMQFLEHFAERTFMLAPLYNSEELREHYKAGRQNFSTFIDELLRKNQATGTPVFIERLNAELLDRGEDEL